MILRVFTKGLMVLALVSMIFLSPKPALAVPVSLELALLVDVSGSVDANEYNLQKTGYVQAFQNPTIHNAISQTTGGIAVTYIEWSGASQQAQLVGWTQIVDAAAANAFAAAIAATTRAFSGLTAVGSAINYGVASFNNTFEGTRLVIDVSGDGTRNDGADTAAARNAAYLAGITINGLAIGNQSLVNWYADTVITSNGFVLQAADFAAFANAVDQKILREIVPTPEPGTILLLGLGLVGIGVSARRKLRK